jgi:hypothetical protein
MTGSCHVTREVSRKKQKETTEPLGFGQDTKVWRVDVRENDS